MVREKVLYKREVDGNNNYCTRDCYRNELLRPPVGKKDSSGLSEIRLGGRRPLDFDT
jgi:hypothetical protein